MPVHATSLVAASANELREKITHVLANDLRIRAAMEEFAFTDGEVVYSRDPSKRKSFREIVEPIVMFPVNLPEGEVGGLETTAFVDATNPMICFNADVCVVEVEPETGKFKVLRGLTSNSEDVGNVINPMIADGQMHGAIVQSLSNTIFEEFIYSDQGQQMTADFEHYKLATAADVPDSEITYASKPCPHTPLGTRGIGEGRPSAVSGALCNAICDALAPFSVEITELPVRPNVLWKKLQAAKASQ